MTKQAAQKEIHRLTELVAYHNKLYYEEGRPEISDYAYDQLLAKLTQLEAQYPTFRLPDSPTQILGDAPSKNFATVYHQYPMLSLSNTYSAAEVNQFIQRTQKQLPNEPIEFFCELKFDGVAASLLYKDGKLDKVVTRGDGVKGDDITQNAQQITSIPKIIPHDDPTATENNRRPTNNDLTAINNNPPPNNNDLPPTFEARGEIFMSTQQFEALNEQRIAYGEEPLANPRNATAGTLKTIKTNAGPKRLLDCYVYALKSAALKLTTHEAGIQLLSKWGFPVSPTYQKCRTLQEVLDYIAYWEKAKKDLPVAIDGIVIKVNAIDQQEKLGYTAKSPRWAIAYKYQPEHIATKLEQVDFQVGRTGIVTPVAHLQPILLAGTTVKRATLHNAQAIARLDLHVGDTVFIEKGGDIIPKVTGVDQTKRQFNSKPVQFIAHCPACNTPLISRYKQTLYYCPNTKGCPPQTQALLAHFVQRKAMDIQAIGKQTIALFLKQGLVHTPADLYKLRYSDIRALEGFQDLSTKNILRGIQQSKQRPFARVLFGLGIPHVGEVVARKLAAYFPSIDELMQATADELMHVPNIGAEIAHSLVHYFQDAANQQMIAQLKDAGLQLHRPTAPAAAHADAGSQPLAGKSFVISGTFANFEREQLKEQLQAKGGKILAAVSGQLHYLVAGKNPGPAKINTAQDLGIPIIHEETIIKMLQ